MWYYIHDIIPYDSCVIIVNVCNQKLFVCLYSYVVCICYSCLYVIVVYSCLYVIAVYVLFVVRVILVYLFMILFRPPRPPRIRFINLLGLLYIYLSIYSLGLPYPFIYLFIRPTVCIYDITPASASTAYRKRTWPSRTKRTLIVST